MAAKILSPSELGTIGDLLGDAAGEFAEHGCNDFGCPATEENKALFIGIIQWQAEQDGADPDPTLIESVEKVQAENEEIYSFDNWAMGYFAQRCQSLVRNPAGASGLSAAEFRMMAALLDLMVEFREIDLEDHDITVDYTLSATDENKQFIASVIEHEGASGWERRVAEVMQSNHEIVVPEHWITRYFSDRCKDLAA
jgi:hypothetical protein